MSQTMFRTLLLQKSQLSRVKNKLLKKKNLKNENKNSQNLQNHKKTKFKISFQSISTNQAAMAYPTFQVSKKAKTTMKNLLITLPHYHRQRKNQPARAQT